MSNRMTPFLLQAFQVEDANAADSDDTAIPTSAAEYLRMVRRQAASLPNVFVSDPALTASATKSAPDAGDSPAIASTRMAPMPDFARPDADWQRQFLGWFADLKETLVAKKTHFDGGQNAKRNLPDGSKGSHQQWRRLIFDEAHYIEPSGDVLMQMEFAQINAALQTLDSCLGDVHSVPRSGPVPDACREDGRRICVDVGDERRSKWLFSLLANLDT